MNHGLFDASLISLFVSVWKIDGPEDINEDSLALFPILDPKIDVLIIGYGDAPKKGQKFPVDTSVIMKMRRKGVNCELLTTENAIATYNYLVEEGRVVAAALIPPNQVKKSEGLFPCCILFVIVFFSDEVG